MSKFQSPNSSKEASKERKFNQKVLNIRKDSDLSSEESLSSNKIGHDIGVQTQNEEIKSKYVIEKVSDQDYETEPPNIGSGNLCLYMHPSISIHS